jgi:hypothetical protein
VQAQHGAVAIIEQIELAGGVLAEGADGQVVAGHQRLAPIATRVRDAGPHVAAGEVSKTAEPRWTNPPMIAVPPAALCAYSMIGRMSPTVLHVLFGGKQWEASILFQPKLLPPLVMMSTSSKLSWPRSPAKSLPVPRSKEKSQGLRRP